MKCAAIACDEEVTENDYKLVSYATGNPIYTYLCDDCRDKIVKAIDDATRRGGN